MFFFSSRRRHTRWPRDWSSDVCSSDLSPVTRLAKPQSPEVGLAGETGQRRYGRPVFVLAALGAEVRLLVQAGEAEAPPFRCSTTRGTAAACRHRRACTSNIRMAAPS